MAKTNTIIQDHKQNFETLKRAFINDDVALMACTIKDTGEKVAVICSVYKDEEKMFNFTPFAMFFNGNPYEILLSAIEEVDNEQEN